jgi:tRNA threonylcarbamoyladenosine biosynthesis protein TsaB
MTDYTLALEGSTYAGSAVLLRGNRVIAERTLVDSGIPSKDGREERVLPSVAECLKDAGVRAGEIARVVCGAGPGSFTSLRISASVAKGIAVGVGCPMYAVSSLLLSVAGAGNPLGVGLYVSVLPAMRGDWFALLVDVGANGSMEPEGAASIIGGTELSQLAAQRSARLIGPGQTIDARPHARGVAKLLDQIVNAGTVSVETWEPDYGRPAEAQVKWEAMHGRPLGAGA